MNTRLQLKVCGMRDPENIQGLAALNPDYIGFIFYEPSPRNVGDSLNEKVVHHLPKGIKKIGVFVNENQELILQKVEQYHLQGIQLHGKESPEQCGQLKAKGLFVWKVFPVGETFDFEQLKPYEKVVDAFLFDTKGPQKGGNGVTFNWNILKQYTLDIPIILSGGIGIEEIEQLEQLAHLPILAIDVNSRMEIKPGLKDLTLVERLISRMMNDE
ncbi:MAG: phosphoribosylanthranilate isomerase [Bacteroidota bacterium]